MKKIMFLVVVALATTGSSCQKKNARSVYCGKKVVSNHYDDFNGYYYLRFKEEGNPNLKSVSVTEADYDYYQPGKVIDCEVKKPVNLPPGKID